MSGKDSSVFLNDVYYILFLYSVYIKVENKIGIFRNSYFYTLIQEIFNIMLYKIQHKNIEDLNKLKKFLLGLLIYSEELNRIIQEEKYPYLQGQMIITRYLPCKCSGKLDFIQIVSEIIRRHGLLSISILVRQSAISNITHTCNICNYAITNVADGCQNLSCSNLWKNTRSSLCSNHNKKKSCSIKPYCTKKCYCDEGSICSPFCNTHLT